MSSDISIGGVTDEKLEGVVDGTEDVTRQGPDGEVLGSTHGAADRSKFGRSALGKSLGAALGAEVGTEIGSTDGF